MGSLRNRRPKRCSALLATFQHRAGTEQLRLVRHADVLVASAFGHDAIVEFDTGSTASEFTHFKSARRLLTDVQPLAVAVGSEEHVIALSVDGLSKRRFQLNNRGSAGETARAKILEPVLWRFDGVQSDFARAAVHGNNRG